MGTTTVLHYQSPLRSSVSTAVTEIRLRRQNFPPKEIAVVVPQTDGDRKGISSTRKSRISALGRLPPKDYGDKAQYSSSSDSKSPKNQEQIISIIRRIRSSIEKEFAKVQERSSNSKSSDENASSLESVLEVLRPPRTPEKTARKEGNKTTLPRRRRDSLRKEPKDELSSSSPLLLTRPPSNFVRKSPIPSSLVEESVDLKNRVDLKRTAAVQEIEKMRLPELKEIAKCNGIKGYSRMKKAELIPHLSLSFCSTFSPSNEFITMEARIKKEKERNSVAGT